LEDVNFRNKLEKIEIVEAIKFKSNLDNTENYGRKKDKMFLLRAMKAHKYRGGILILTFHLGANKLSDENQSPGHFTAGARTSSTFLIRDLVASGAGLDALGKIKIPLPETGPPIVHPQTIASVPVMLYRVLTGAE
jgi:hypothetical protein